MEHSTLQAAIGALERATVERAQASVELSARTQEFLTAQRALSKATERESECLDAVTRAQNTLNAVLDSIK